MSIGGSCRKLLSLKNLKPKGARESGYNLRMKLKGLRVKQKADCSGDSGEETFDIESEDNGLISNNNSIAPIFRLFLVPWCTMLFLGKSGKIAITPSFPPFSPQRVYLLTIVVTNNYGRRMYVSNNIERRGIKDLLSVVGVKATESTLLCEMLIIYEIG